MAQGHGQIKLPFGTVYWSAWPTDMDKTGCDGLYVERVEWLPWRKWPLRYMLRVLGMTTLKQAEARLQAAQNLDELLETIRTVHAELDEEDRGHLDLTDLPTFGGQEPDDTAAVWSWDADRLLVGLCVSEFRIRARDEA